MGGVGIWREWWEEVGKGKGWEREVVGVKGVLGGGMGRGRVGIWRELCGVGACRGREEGGTHCCLSTPGTFVSGL